MDYDERMSVHKALAELKILGDRIINTISSGFCIVVHDFMAYVVPFRTARVSYAYQTIPWYEVKTSNGDIEGFNEFDLFTDKAKAERECKKMNKRMKEKREFWLSEGLPAIRGFERLGF